MRTDLTIFRVVCLVLAGCSSETVEQPPAAPANWQSLQVRPVVDAGADIITAKERALPDAYAAALGSSGFAQLGPLLDEDADFAFPGMDNAHGREMVVRAHDTLFGAFDDRKMTLLRVWRTPSEQTIEWTMTATQARDWMGVPATQKPVVLQGLTLLWTKDDGSLKEVHVTFDVSVVKAQLGVGPKPLLALPRPTVSAGGVQVYDQPAGADDRSVALVSAALDALENNKESEYVGSFADDSEVFSLEHPQPAHGKADAKSYYVRMHKAIGQLDTTKDNAWSVGPFAIVEYSISGEQLGPLDWIAGQRDQVIRFEIVDICEIQGGKIARVWRYDNPAQIESTRLK